MSDIDGILDQASTPQDEVKLCVNGKIRRRYNALKAEIAEDQAAAREEAIAAAATAIVDDRLGAAAGSGPDGEPAPAPVPPHPRQADLDALVELMKQHTVRVVLEAVDPDEWQQLLEAHPPRKDPTTGKIVPEDAGDMVNASTFYPALVRRSVVAVLPYGRDESAGDWPPVTDEQYKKLRRSLSAAQAERLKAAAASLNVQDEDLPF